MVQRAPRVARHRRAAREPLRLAAVRALPEQPVQLVARRGGPDDDGAGRAGGRRQDVPGRRRRGRDERGEGGGGRGRRDGLVGLEGGGVRWHGRMVVRWALVVFLWRRRREIIFYQLATTSRYDVWRVIG